MKFVVAILITTLVYSFQVTSEPVVFETPEQQQRFQSLLEEIRCLVCQNQSLSDSNADLARDLRNEVYRMVSEGQSDQQIIDFLVARYGDFVLYRPPLKTTTLLLWFGPFILLLIALVGIYRFVKSARVEEVTISAVDQSRVSQLLGEKE